MRPIAFRNIIGSKKGIIDEYWDKEQINNDLCKQIFEKYGYNPVSPLNFDNELQIGDSMGYDTDYGIDEVIYIEDIPEDDPLNLKRFKPNKWDDIAYTIDYKSNNGNYLNSIYVKLMVYRRRREYLPFYEENGEIIYPFKKHLEIDRKRWEKALKKGKKDIRSNIKLYYGNRWILSDDNKTEYFFYAKHSKPKDPNDTTLQVAYLVPAPALRKQVADTLNQVLKKDNSKLRIKSGHDFNLNHKIMKAFQICEGEVRDSDQMELFKPRKKKDILLRIPENLLISHIKFNEYGDIITSS